MLANFSSRAQSSSGRAKDAKDAKKWPVFFPLGGLGASLPFLFDREKRIRF
ncbi:MAG TPA: hypothetical protein VK968_15775 [Roseimicrobium sp.]|nr:hypothetical protein [Roseimicrobium sp.]